MKLKLYLKAEANKQQVYTDLDIEAGQLLSNWEHFAIMELMKTKDFNQVQQNSGNRLYLSLNTLSSFLPCHLLSTLTMQMSYFIRKYTSELLSFILHADNVK